MLGEHDFGLGAAHQRAALCELIEAAGAEVVRLLGLVHALRRRARAEPCAISSRAPALSASTLRALERAVRFLLVLAHQRAELVGVRARGAGRGLGRAAVPQRKRQAHADRIRGKHRAALRAHAGRGDAREQRVVGLLCGVRGGARGLLLELQRAQRGVVRAPAPAPRRSAAARDRARRVRAAASRPPARARAARARRSPRARSSSSLANISSARAGERSALGRTPSPISVSTRSRRACASAAASRAIACSSLAPSQVRYAPRTPRTIDVRIASSSACDDACAARLAPSAAGVRPKSYRLPLSSSPSSLRSCGANALDPVAQRARALHQVLVGLVIVRDRDQLAARRERALRFHRERRVIRALRLVDVGRGRARARFAGVERRPRLERDRFQLAQAHDLRRGRSRRARASSAQREHAASRARRTARRSCSCSALRSSHPAPCLLSHSRRSASIGSSAAARLAGM